MRIFNADSPLMEGLSKITDLVILNLVVLVCCLPVITAGAALTGMHYVLLKMVRNEEGYIVRSYFKSFKQNFLQATGMWMIFLAVGILFLLDLRLSGGAAGTAIKLPADCRRHLHFYDLPVCISPSLPLYQYCFGHTAQRCRADSCFISPHDCHDCGNNSNAADRLAF